MAKDINQLTERIKKIDRESKLALIYETMIDFGISSGDIVEYCATRGSVTVTTSQRLREIGKARRAGRNRVEMAAKARQAKVEKRKKLMETAAAVAPAPKPKLSLDVSTLDGIGEIDV